jgi:hypothetical protein
MAAYCATFCLTPFAASAAVPGLANSVPATDANTACSRPLQYPSDINNETLINVPDPSSPH